jgi:hypothetical protein
MSYKMPEVTISTDDMPKGISWWTMDYVYGDSENPPGTLWMMIDEDGNITSEGEAGVLAVH